VSQYLSSFVYPAFTVFLLFHCILKEMMVVPIYLNNWDRSKSVTKSSGNSSVNTSNCCFIWCWKQHQNICFDVALVIFWVFWYVSSYSKPILTTQIWVRDVQHNIKVGRLNVSLKSFNFALSNWEKTTQVIFM